jgi:hypothetical protein
MRVRYTMLFIGQVPVFGRPERETMAEWRPHRGWRLVTPAASCKRVLALPSEQRSPASNFVLRFQEVQAKNFRRFLKRIASKIPRPQRGSLVVVVSPACVPAWTYQGPAAYVKGDKPTFLWFGVLHDRGRLDDGEWAPPKGFERVCPTSI